MNKENALRKANLPLLSMDEDFAMPPPDALSEANAELLEKMEKLPINLTVQHVADFLGISKSTAYNVVNAPGFPIRMLPGTRRKVIPKIKFIEWYLT